MMESEIENVSQPEGMQQPKKGNWRMPVCEQVQLHQALLRRRLQEPNNGVSENTLVFIECATDAGPLYFSHAFEQTPLREPAPTSTSDERS